MKPDPTCCATPSSAPREKRTRSPPITCTGRVDIPALILYSLMHTLYQVRVTHGGNSRSPWLRRRPAAQAPHSARTSPLRTVRAVCGAVSVPCAVCLHERCQRALPPCSRPHPPNFRGRGREHSSSKDSKQADGTLHGNSKIKIKTQRPRYHQLPGGRGTMHMTATGTACHRAGGEPARRKVKVKLVGWRLRRRSAPGHASAQHKPGRRGKPAQHALLQAARPAWNIATGTGGILAGTHAR